jgi:hypothetical protein
VSNQTLTSIDPSLSGMGFTQADKTASNRMIVSVCGLEKQGKTHFALTAPGPIAYFNADIGMEGVVGKFISAKQVLVKEVFVPTDKDKAMVVVDGFRAAYKAVLASRKIRSIVWDTATELWELLRVARFGKLTQVMPLMYGPVNAEYRGWLRDAYDSDKNLILLHKMKPVYVNDKRTAEYDRSGFSDTGFLVQVNAQVYRDSPDDGGTFNLFIKDCRQNPDLAGQVLSGEMCGFPWLAAMAMGTGVGEWE